jgi:surfeit locus 1 family protein
VVFIALGVWQMERLAWKEALIARVNARVHAPPVAPPGPADWPGVSASADEYRHVAIGGTFLNDRETLVQAVTEAGPGYWVMTPLRADAGYGVLINRGFVPMDSAAPADRRAGLIARHTTVTGLLRISEPHGGFLHANDPAGDRWYSRDVAAIARARGLTQVAPYFIDADAAPNVGGLPRGGLTVIRFPNSHLVYALTWFALAAMTAVGLAWPAIEQRRARRRSDEGPQSVHDPHD